MSTAARETAVLARQLAELASDDAALSARAARLAERVAAQQFHIGVLGDFKRGKSTLVNALIGRAVLPSGVVPVTTVVTEVHFGTGEPGVTVTYVDGRAEAIDDRDVADYVSEERNPGNRRGVARVVVCVPETFAVPGVVLVDTPGLGSVHEHQTAAAHGALAESDGAVVVLSADSPLSDTERGIVVDLASRGAPLFVVVNKCDHLDESELETVRAYVTAQLRPLADPPPLPYLVSARNALDGRGDQGFDAFAAALRGFVREDLAAAREATAFAELERLAARRAIALEMERVAGGVDADRLARQLASFESAAVGVRRQFTDDRLVLDHAADELARSVGDVLAGGAAAAAAQQWPAVLAPVGVARGRALDRALDDAVTEAVRQGFEPLRARAERSLDDGWTELALRFARQTQERADRLREMASELFDLRLPTVPVPPVEAQRRRFSYFFLQVETPGSSLWRTLVALAPSAWSRRTMLERARRRLSDELGKHAGRARYDLTERLHEAKQAFVAAMTAELDEVEHAIVDAAHRARALLDASTEERRGRDTIRAQTVALVHDIEHIAARAREAAAPVPAGGAAPESTRSLPDHLSRSSSQC
jgi:small GTP-binding protein